MHLKKLIERPNIAGNSNILGVYGQFAELLDELEKRELPDEVTGFINQEIEKLNSVPDTAGNFVKTVRDTETRVVRLVEKKCKVVPRNYYRKLWFVVGMSVFGVPIGVTLGTAVGNLGLLGIGLPIGMAIGLGVGTGLDRKALKEGRQLNIELKR